MWIEGISIEGYEIHYSSYHTNSTIEQILTQLCKLPKVESQYFCVLSINIIYG